MNDAKQWAHPRPGRAAADDASQSARAAQALTGPESPSSPSPSPSQRQLAHRRPVDGTRPGAVRAVDRRRCRPTILAIDLGLTAVKAVLVDGEGRIVAAARTFWERGWSTADAVTGSADAVPDIWPELCRTARAVLAAAQAEGPGSAYDVVAVVPTVAAQSGVCIDAGGAPFSLGAPPDSPPWEDAAAAPWGPDGATRYGYGATLLRYARAAYERDRARFGRIARIGPLHAYVLWRLSGVWAADPASGPGERRWPADAVAWARLGPAALPAILDGEAVAGALLPEAARAMGVASGLPVVTGSHDGSCASFGAGAYRIGDCALTLSTNFVPRPVVGRRLPGAFGYPIRPGAWAWVQGLPLAGRQIDLARATLVTALGGDQAAADGLAAASHVAYRSRTSRPDLPYLAAAAIQGQDERVRAALALGWSPAAVYLAVVAGCAEAVVRRVHEGEVLGAPARRFVATGGLSRLAVLRAVLGDLLGAPLATAGPEAGALGAAALAAAAIGWFPTPEAAISAFLHAPDPSAALPASTTGIVATCKGGSGVDVDL